MGRKDWQEFQIPVRSLDRTHGFDYTGGKSQNHVTDGKWGTTGEHGFYFADRLGNLC